MSGELRNLHEELLSLIDELEALTSNAAVEREAVTRIRWRLSRTSRQRLKLLEEVIYPGLAQRAAPDEIETVERLRDTNKTDLAASRAHVAAWTTERALADWRGYSEASSQMRDVMRARITLEKAILYPLLDRYLS